MNFDAVDVWTFIFHILLKSRSTYCADQTGRVEKIGGGKYLWLGSFESIRVGWKLRLNVDMANKPAYEKGKWKQNIE